jgi:hypothetical protein
MAPIDEQIEQARARLAAAVATAPPEGISAEFIEARRNLSTLLDERRRQQRDAKKTDANQDNEAVVISLPPEARNGKHILALRNGEWVLGPIADPEGRENPVDTIFQAHKSRAQMIIRVDVQNPEV